MEISPNSDTKLPVRRRLIQSTLIPHKSVDNVVCVDEDSEPDVEQEDDEEDYCGSQSQVKKNKKRKPKAASQSRASRKIAANGNEIRGKNAEEEDSPATVSDFFLKVSERRNQRRQQKEQLLILSPDKVEQSCSPSDIITIPHKSQDNVINVDKDQEPDEDQEDDEEDYCGSQSQVKKNKKQKPKATPQSRALRKLAVNGNEIEGKNGEEEDSPAIVSDFFLKVSERRHQRRQQKEQLPEKLEQSCSPSDAITIPHKSQDNVISLDEHSEPDVDHEDNGEDYCGSSQVKKNKKRKPKATPQSQASRKQVAVNGNEVGGKNIEEQDSPAIVKGNFFLKVSERRSQRRQKKEQLPNNSPEKTEKICSPSDAITNSKSPRKPRRRASATPKKRQTSGTPKKHEMNLTPSGNAINGALFEDPSDKLLTSPLKPIPDLRLEAKMTAEENSRIFAGKQIHPFFSSWKAGKKNTESSGLENKWCHVEGKENHNDFKTFHVFEKTQDETFSIIDWGNWTFSESISARTSQDSEDSCLHLINEGSVDCLQFDNFLEEKNLITSPMVDKQKPECIQVKDIETPKNNLWTTKYQPERAIEICGNNESVKFLNEWLRLWYEKGSSINKCSTDNNNWKMQGVDLNYSPTDSDSESTDEETGLKNVLLVTGPVGSGKSAAIYACAQEQGFQVIEVNTSDWRNGALVKQKFGEAVESHWLKCSMVNSENPDNMNQLKPSSTTCNIELIPLSDDDDDDLKNVKPSSSQNGTKTLILFEDIDANLCEDRGFISTIQQLAETAKRPMILTSNSDDPDLPSNLDRIEVNFRIPSSDELLTLANTVCTEEKAEIDPCLVERFIIHCQGDIRKTIMLLQFWCQGQNCKKDTEIRKTYAPLLFDTNASHHVLPQMIPSGHSSKLSEFIEKEITKSSLLAEKDEIIEEEEEEEEEEENIDAKKAEMLRRHNEFPSCSSSPVAFRKRTLEKKYDPVTASDSGDYLDVSEDLNEEVVVGEKRLRRKYNSVMSSDSEDDEGLCDKSFGCFSNISCVPESSYVPETQIENGTMSTSTDFTSRITPVEFNVSCEEEEDKVAEMAVDDLSLDVGPTEETGDSYIEHMADISRDFQMMDECSRIDFKKKTESITSTDFIQETWRKLRNCEHELRQYVSDEEKHTLEALRISSGMTNLISEADLLLADCQSLTCDYLKPSMVSAEKSHSSSWHDDQLQMASTIGQHGFCVYAKKGSNDKVDLAWEMLAASTNTISLGKFINRNKMVKDLGKKNLQSGVSLKSMLESPLCGTVQSIVPLRSQLSLKGYVFHEYLSTLSQISRSESSRFSEAINNSNQRRKRVARNYLSNGGLSLSSEDISWLDKYSSQQKQKLSRDLV